jgi:hypothetical protein
MQVCYSAAQVAQETFQLLGEAPPQKVKKSEYTALEKKVSSFKPVRQELQLLVDQCFATITISASRWLLSVLSPKDWLTSGLPFLCVTHNSAIPRVTAEQYSAKEASQAADDKVPSYSAA